MVAQRSDEKSGDSLGCEKAHELDTVPCLLVSLLYRWIGVDEHVYNMFTKYYKVYLYCTDRVRSYCPVGHGVASKALLAPYHRLQYNGRWPYCTYFDKY